MSLFRLACVVASARSVRAKHEPPLAADVAKAKNEAVNEKLRKIPLAVNGLDASEVAARRPSGKLARWS